MTEDEQEAHSIKWNVARIVKLTSGAFALFAHYQDGGLPLIQIGTLAELESFIPTAEECSYEYSPPERKAGKQTFLDLADLGL